MLNKKETKETFFVLKVSLVNCQQIQKEICNQNLFEFLY
jgi:hypothetical protein